MGKASASCLVLSAKPTCSGCWSVSRRVLKKAEKEEKHPQLFTGSKSIKERVGKTLFWFKWEFMQDIHLKCSMGTCCEKQKFFILQSSDTVNPLSLCRQWEHHGEVLRHHGSYLQHRSFFDQGRIISPGICTYKSHHSDNTRKPFCLQSLYCITVTYSIVKQLF